MFFRIPKKDQKRRKTNNIILLIFILPATMFFSSNVNNVLAVTEGIDAFWEKANMTHTEAMYTPDISDENTVPRLKDMDSYDMIPTVYINTNQLTHEGKALDVFTPLFFLMRSKRCSTLKNRFHHNCCPGNCSDLRQLTHKINGDISLKSKTDPCW